MNKIFFGIVVAIAALSVSAFTTISDDFDAERVGKIDANQWAIILDEERGITWDCFPNGTACTGTLKAGATPDTGGFYSDNEVSQILENKHFEYLNAPKGHINIIVKDK